MSDELRKRNRIEGQAMIREKAETLEAENDQLKDELASAYEEICKLREVVQALYQSILYAKAYYLSESAFAEVESHWNGYAGGPDYRAFLDEVMRADND